MRLIAALATSTLLLSGCVAFDRTARDYRACEGLSATAPMSIGVSEQIRQEALPHASARLGRDLFELANLQDDLEQGTVLPSPSLLRQIEQLTTKVVTRCSEVTQAANHGQPDPSYSGVADSEPTENSQGQIQDSPSDGSQQDDDGSDSQFAGSLESLPIEPENRNGYDRDLFEHWIDEDGDGCDTRREVLIQESLTPVTVGPACDITGGMWVSLYDGFSSANPSDFDIDHMVPLAEAWDSGASSWGDSRRRDFANDMKSSYSLVAVSKSSNRSKSDGDPADWLPADIGYVCEYVQQWVSVKQRWELTVDEAEAGVLKTILATC